MANDWISMHIFYASNINPMLVYCVGPLATDLRQRGLIQRYFFIKYWLEGPHMRLRLLPAADVAEEAVKQAAAGDIQYYLQRRPSLYSVEGETVHSFYKDMFVAEYSEEEWYQRYPDGQMRFQPNNSIAYIEYEREYGRYGGPQAIEVAEWHFQKSSDIVIRLLRDTNTHVRSILLGLAIQLMFCYCYGFFRYNEEIIDFLTGYIAYWRRNFSMMTDAVDANYEKIYPNMAAALEKRVSDLQQTIMAEGQSGRLTTIERDWIIHISQLRQKIDQLVAARQLVMGTAEPVVVTDTTTAYHALLTSYIHMTNNRLGVLFSDEVYLAYLLKRCLAEMNDSVKEVV